VGTSQAKWESNSAGPARGFTGSANDRFEKAEFSIGSAFLMVLGSPSREVGVTICGCGTVVMLGVLEDETASVFEEQ
jgi:hypothetical protein